MTNITYKQEYIPPKVNKQENQKHFLQDTETLKLLKNKLKEFNERLKENRKNRNDFLAIYKKNINKDNEFYFYLYKTLLNLSQKNIFAEIKTFETLIKRAKFEQLTPEQKAKIPHQREFDLETIKQIPIEKLLPIGVKYRKSQNRLYLCCPLHNEKTASFVIYLDSNTFYCFGACGVGGDNIKFIQLLNNVSFLEASNFLKGYL